MKEEIEKLSLLMKYKELLLSEWKLESDSVWLIEDLSVRWEELDKLDLSYRPQYDELRKLIKDSFNKTFNLINENKS